MKRFASPVVWPPNQPTGIILNAMPPFVLPDPSNIQFEVYPPGQISISGTVTTANPAQIIVVMKDMASDSVDTVTLADDGSYTFAVKTQQSVLVLALQSPGRKFAPGRTLSVGEVVRPSQFNGWVYEVTVAGYAPDHEPHWWLPVGGEELGMIGTAQARVIPYVQPRAHGPVQIVRN